MSLTTSTSVSPLVAALNDRARTRIGNPRRGTFYVSIALYDADQATKLGNQLDLIGVAHQTNVKHDGGPTIAYLAIYSLDDQRRLLDTLGSELDPGRREALETLVAARGPIPPDLFRKLEYSLQLGRTYEYLAAKLNEHGIIDGMGAREWTAKKLRRKLAEAADAARSEAEARRAA